MKKLLIIVLLLLAGCSDLFGQAIGTPADYDRLLTDFEKGQIGLECSVNGAGIILIELTEMGQVQWNFEDGCGGGSVTDYSCSGTLPQRTINDCVTCNGDVCGEAEPVSLCGDGIFDPAVEQCDFSGTTKGEGICTENGLGNSCVACTCVNDQTITVQAGDISDFFAMLDQITAGETRVECVETFSNGQKTGIVAIKMDPLTGGAVERLSFADACVDAEKRHEFICTSSRTPKALAYNCDSCQNNVCLNQHPDSPVELEEMPLSCPNGVVELTEACDPLAPQVQCIHLADGFCDIDCRCKKIPEENEPDFDVDDLEQCGNGFIEGNEQCDPQGFPTDSLLCLQVIGPLAICTSNCQCAALSDDVSDIQECGNSVVEDGEQCDPPDAVTTSSLCVTQYGLDAKCSSNCQCLDGADEDFSPINNQCGNLVTEFGEQCDPPDYPTEAPLCDQLEGSNALCNFDCQCEQAPSEIFPLNNCGNGDIEAREQCDPPNSPTDSLLCFDQYGNDAFCSSDCQCTSERAPVCGNQITEFGEWCDSGMAGGPSPECGSGSSCDSSCSCIVASSGLKLSDPIRGNGQLEGFEQCENAGTPEGNRLCQLLLGPTSICLGDMTCAKPLPRCGNEIIQPGEQCDPPNTRLSDTTWCTIGCQIVSGTLSQGPQSGSAAALGDDSGSGGAGGGSEAGAGETITGICSDSDEPTVAFAPRQRGSGLQPFVRGEVVDDWGNPYLDYCTTQPWYKLNIFLDESDPGNSLVEYTCGPTNKANRHVIFCNCRDGKCVTNVCIDNDLDGYGALGSDLSACTASRTTPDCNDAEATVHLGATEVCSDNLDNDCDGQINEGCATPPTNLCGNSAVDSGEQCDDGRNGDDLDGCTDLCTSCTAPPPGLVGWWEANGNAEDSIGPNDGVLVPNQAPGYVSGIVGQAFTFDGNDDLLKTGVVGLPTGNPDFSVALWVKSDNFASNKIITQYGRANELDHKGVHMIAFFNSLQIPEAFGFGIFEYGGPTGSAGPGATNWHHIVGTLDSVGADTVLKLYKDGVLLETFNNPNDILDITSDGINDLINVFGGGNTGHSYFKGQMDEIMYFNHVLTQQEAEFLFQRSVSQGSWGDLCRPGTTGGTGTGGSSCTDFDLDGYGDQGTVLNSCTGSTTVADCNDLDYDINPGEIDVCGNGIDENCDGNVDETCVSTMAVTTAIRSSGPFDTFSSVTSTGVAVPPTQPPVKFFTTGTITSPLALPDWQVSGAVTAGYNVVFYTNTNCHTNCKWEITNSLQFEGGKWQVVQYGSGVHLLPLGLSAYGFQVTSGSSLITSSNGNTIVLQLLRPFDAGALDQNRLDIGRPRDFKFKVRVTDESGLTREGWYKFSIV